MMCSTCFSKGFNGCGLRSLFWSLLAQHLIYRSASSTHSMLQRGLGEQLELQDTEKSSRHSKYHAGWTRLAEKGAKLKLWGTGHDAPPGLKHSGCTEDFQEPITKDRARRLQRNLAERQDSQKKKNGTGWANREVKHKVSGSRELMNWVRNRGENNYSMVKGGINRDLDEISIKGTRGGWGKESNQTKAGQEENKTSIFNSEMGIRMRKLRN